MKRLSKTLFNKKSVAWLFTTLMLATTIATPLAMLAPVPSTQAQNAQNTDIFTGQFIPAYLGAAYDPTEAYKVMAGMTVYVFAYDRWDTIVNNFAYKTQVKADGSFQAAGLPNASHYGVCVTSSALVHEYFRAPKPEDGIQSTFAYNLQTYKGATPRTQLPDGAGRDFIDCQSFTTSSRTADIKNHHNIFPLVPKTVLSVIIRDGAGDNFYNNSPYEVYAQRISTNKQPTSSMDVPDDAISTTGPIVRGRTIKTGSTHTIFQAFAPEGNYAITYWRPDSRSANAQITYLTYDGVSSIGSTQNGIAFKKVYDANRSFTIKTSSGESLQVEGNAWQIEKYISDGTGIGSNISIKTYWESSLGSINLWGTVTESQDGLIRPKSGKNIKTENTQLGFYDIANMQCAQPNPQQHITNHYGVYLLTSSCREGGRTGTLVNNGSITAKISVLSDGTSTSEQASISVSVNGVEGPARRDISLMSIPSVAFFGDLVRNNKPFAFANVSLKIDNKLHRNVAQADSTGFFYIPQRYFQERPGARYQIIASPGYNPPNFESRYANTYAIDAATVTAIANGRPHHIGTIAINQKQLTPVQSMLASISLDKLLPSIRIPTALAQIRELEPYTFSGNDSIELFIDLRSIGNAVRGFNAANYNLRTVELNPPSGVESIGTSTNDSKYEFYYGDGDGKSNDAAILTIDGTGESTPNSLITGVQLKKKDTVVSIDDMFDDFGTDTLDFNLRLNFQYRHSDPVAGANEVNSTQLNQYDQASPNQLGSTGQDESTGYPRILASEWPITITRSENGGSYTYTANYDPIVLNAEAPNCGGGSLLKDGFSKVLQNTVCKLVIAGVEMIKNILNKIADTFLTVDPINGFGSTIIVKYWNTIRNFVNSLAVLILVIAGIAIMLRYNNQTFRIQSVLTNLIIAIVLVNFSILLIQVVLDIINVFALGGYHMLIDSLTVEGREGLNGANSAMGALASVLMAQIVVAAASGFTGFFAYAIIIAGFIILIGYSIYKIAIQYFLRLVVLWICIIMAPLAFASNILPQTQGIFTRWKGYFIGALVGQIALAMVLSLSFSMIASLGYANGGLEAGLLTIACFALLYMATIIPTKAAAMYGDSSMMGKMEGGLMKGLSKARTLTGAGINRFAARRKVREDVATGLGLDRNTRRDRIEGAGELARNLGMGRAGQTFARLNARRQMNKEITSKIKADEKELTGGIPGKAKDLAFRGLGTSVEDIDKAETAAIEQLDKDQATLFKIRNPRVAERLRSTQRTKQIEDMLKPVFRMNLNSMLAEGNPTINALRTVDPNIRLDDAHGRRIIADTETDFIEAMVEQAFRASTLDPAARTAAAQAIFDNHFRGVAIETVGDFRDLVEGLNQTQLNEFLSTTGHSEQAIDALGIEQKRELFARSIEDASAAHRSRTSRGSNATTRIAQINNSARTGRNVPSSAAPPPPVGGTHAPVNLSADQINAMRWAIGDPSADLSVPVGPGTLPENVTTAQAQDAIDTVNIMTSKFISDGSLTTEEREKLTRAYRQLKNWRY